MRTKLMGLLFGAGFGFVLAWTRMTDPGVIRAMLLLREPDIFLLMGVAVVVAGAGVRLLRAARMRALVSGEPIQWSLQPPEARHVAGSVLFGAGWSIAGTCPGPVAAMIGEGHLGALFVALGLFAGVRLQAAFEGRRAAAERADVPGAAGL